MRTIARKGKNGRATAKCPYCAHPNVLADTADVCDHLYEVAKDNGKNTFFFVKGHEKDIRGKRMFNGKIY